MMVKEGDEERIVLADSVVKNIFYGLFGIAVGLFMLLGWIAHSDFSDIGLLEIYVGLFAVLVFGGIFIGGFVQLMVKKSIIIDKRLRSVTILEESPIKYFESIEKIPFAHIRRIEITYKANYEGCDYDSPQAWAISSWDISLITSDEGSLQICDSGSKSKAEKIAREICGITGKNVTHRAECIGSVA